MGWVGHNGNTMGAVKKIALFHFLWFFVVFWGLGVLGFWCLGVLGSWVVALLSHPLHKGRSLIHHSFHEFLFHLVLVLVLLST